MMSSQHTNSDPSTRSSTYDYRSDSVERPELAATLSSLVDGEVRLDDYTRTLYATDASAYEVQPVGVVYPTSTDDVAAVVAYCDRNDIAVLPRGGGTSLAGQSVNDAVVLDCSKHMDALLDVDSDRRCMTAQPGITLGKLNETLESEGLKFAPDPAWGDKSVLGGAIGNNSTGAHSLVYGKTDAYVESVEAVLADGTVTRFGDVTIGELRDSADADSEALLPRIYAGVLAVLDDHAEEVDSRYPELKRNVSGYNFDRLLEEARDDGEITDDATVNLARLLAGSEGTLAIVTEATVSLESIPNTKAVALLTYDDLLDALADVEPILEHDPAAVEVMDDVLLGLARDTAEFADVVGMLPEGTDSVLLVEFYADDDAEGRRLVADLLADRVPAADSEADPTDERVRTNADHRAAAAMEAHDADTRAKFWKMRKSGLPILLGRTTDEKHIAYIEDTAVPARNLPEYVADVQEILDDYDTYASYYAHAGPGVLHIRPLVNTKSVEGLEAFEAIAERVTDLVVKYGGSVSGEHGDGRARTQWNRKLYGDDLWAAFRDLKTAYDPNWTLNPGNVCGDHDLTENLRFDPDYGFESGFSPELSWDNDNGFQGMVELCHGCGGCRGEQSTTGGVMCPTYRAAHEEIQSTRGRANMLRQAMSGGLPEEELFSEDFTEEVLDLCVGCKGCARDCPSEVDMAKLRTEVLHEKHQRDGTSLRDRLFANIDRLSALGSRFAPVANAATSLPGAGFLAEKTLGIASERDVPTFASESLVEWFEARGGATVPEADADRRVVVFPDTYTNYNDPAVGKAAIEVLEAAGVHVVVPDGLPGSGRPPLSKGFVEKAREDARANVDALAQMVEDGWDVVVVEPSDAVMFQSDYLDLLSGDDVERLAANAYGVCEYLDRFRLDERLDFEGVEDALAYHGHCHQKATKKDHHAVGVLRRAGYAVDPVDSTCCGMAGSFGYEAEHYSMSQAIADLLRDQLESSDGESVVAPGTSCRTQLDEESPAHPVEKLADALV
ncbi:FAD-binding and (Fe-S)-binding domain-containing protein [Natronomonas gomsonensis]|uniref:FAD-binding and (Fe-S)-binding domain-containing protein n=1 Tax=Natronomonas gomsonensis TaxID=1046043 RepID=UPI00398C6EAA